MSDQPYPSLSRTISQHFAVEPDNRKYFGSFVGSFERYWNVCCLRAVEVLLSNEFYRFWNFWFSGILWEFDPFEKCVSNFVEMCLKIFLLPCLLKIFLFTEIFAKYSSSTTVICIPLLHKIIQTSNSLYSRNTFESASLRNSERKKFPYHQKLNITICEHSRNGFTSNHGTLIQKERCWKSRWRHGRTDLCGEIR